MLVFPIVGECVLSGIWTTITASRGFDASILNPPRDATHYIRYTTGATAALQVGELLTGGTSTKTAYLLAQAVENGTAGSGDSGILFLRLTSDASAYTAAGETFTGGVSTGTVATAQQPIPLMKYSTPKGALITVETAAINFTIDGTKPTATAGTNFGCQIGSGQSYVIAGWNNIRNFKCINSVNASGAIVKYQLFA